MYVAEERAQKLRNASVAWLTAARLRMLPENTNARKTRRFLYHCCGRNSLTISQFILLISSKFIYKGFGYRFRKSSRNESMSARSRSA